MKNTITQRIPLYGLTASLLAMTTIVVLTFFQKLHIEGSTLAIDWQQIYWGIYQGKLTYASALVGVRYPPWSMLLLLPLGYLPMQVGWGVLALATLFVLIISVPKPTKNKFWVGIGLSVLAFPTLRTIADGNLEFMVIGGLLLILQGYRDKNIFTFVIGVLLATTKVQEVWLLMLALPFYALRNWSYTKIGQGLLIIGGITIPTMLWQGREWIRSIFDNVNPGSLVNCSLIATLDRLHVSTWISAILWLSVLFITAIVLVKNPRPFGRTQMALLVTASLLLAPYAAGNNYLTPYSIGVIPALQTSPMLGLPLIVLTNLPYLLLPQRSLAFAWGATYWAFVLIVTWGIFIAWLLRQNPPGGQPLESTTHA